MAYYRREKKLFDPIRDLEGDRFGDHCGTGSTRLILCLLVADDGTATDVAGDGCGQRDGILNGEADVSLAEVIADGEAGLAV